METFFKNITAEEGTKAKFTQDLMTLIHDAEEMVKATGGSLAEKSKDELMAALTRLKSTCRRVEEHAIASSLRTARLIGDHPYSAVSIAFAAGVILGALARRR